MAIVARLLRGEPLELVVRETNVSIARLSEWRDRALTGAATALKERERDDRDDEIARLKSKVGEITIDSCSRQKLATWGAPSVCFRAPKVPCLRRPPHSICTTSDSCTAAKRHAVGRLFDQLNGAGEQAGRHLDAEGLAALRLTSSNSIGSSTGRSAGFAPLRTLSTYWAARRYVSAKAPRGHLLATYPVWL